MNALNRVLTRVLLVTLVSLEQKCCLEFRERWEKRDPGYREFAYSVYIRMSSASDKFCTGTLIDKRWVVTAARCMYQGTSKMVETDTSVTVYARVDDRSKLNDTNVQNRTSMMVRVYQDSYHSLALIKLKDPFVVGDGVESAAVTFHGFVNVEDEICLSGSYGTVQDKFTTLKHMEFDTTTCKCHEQLIKKYPKELVDKWVCGHSKITSQGICQGDIGMGMICDGALQAINIGVVFLKNKKSCNMVEEFAPECQHDNQMGLFVDICYYIEWIRQYVQKVETARIACNVVSTAAPATATLKWVMCFGLLSYLYVRKINIW